MNTIEAASPLDADQSTALASLPADTDLLFTGGAGTGKTRVLLEALLQGSRTEPSEANQPHLITFSRTLAKYDAYKAAMMRSAAISRKPRDQDQTGAASLSETGPLSSGPGLSIAGDSYGIMTSETFFWQALKAREPKHRVDYDYLRRLIPDANTTGILSDGELWIEIEEFVFGLNISREEYIEAHVPRRGLRTALNRVDREEVWAIGRKLGERMVADGVYSKQFARLRLLGWLENDLFNAGELPESGPLYVDESQDMSAAELLCLKALSPRALVMAGDSGQSIYGFISPYRRASLELPQSSIRVLSVNHRNTIAIHQWAEDFRIAGLSEGEDPGPVSHPYRKGPAPRLYSGEDESALAQLLAAHVRYQVQGEKRPPDRIGVLCSRNAHLETMKSLLADAGLPSSVIRDRDFDFAETGTIRLSTLHSAKGLDFDAVFIFLPELPPAREIDAAYQTRLYRNLIYVACSRAKDVLEVFSVCYIDSQLAISN